jgi:adenine-specific DNA-methyltransferase
MSRLTELISRIKAKDPQAGADLEREFKALSSRREFGLNFERHRPEEVELPGRVVRKGDKVRILPERGNTEKGTPELWLVKKIEKNKDKRIATLVSIEKLETKIEQVNIDDLIVVAEFNDYIYPGLVSTGKIERKEGKPYHTVINGENYHALKALSFSHKGKVDVVYIDPPYNSGAKDWKYNNDYVEADDLYRHSKWLAFMERRLILAKQLLNPKGSALICTIDEKEFLRIGLLLEQTFPEAKIQMVSSLINAKGIIRANELTRTNEFVFFVILGDLKLVPEIIGDNTKKVRWASLRRTDLESARGTKKGGPEQFYPIYVNEKENRIEKIGEFLTPEQDYKKVPQITGCTTIFPIRENGNVEMNWGLTGTTLKARLKKGYVRVITSSKRKKKITIYYLTSGQIEDIEKGNLLIKGNESCGSVILEYATGKSSMPTTHWSRDSHNAQSHGSNLLKELLGDRTFPFPKSLYAIEDALRLIVGNNKKGIVLDFFSGSGTTSHAVMRLNRQDNGDRQCILVTNNEVSADEQKSLAEKGLRPGDIDWEKWGICEYITKPRIKAAISGKKPNGKAIQGEYKFIDEFPMSEGFEENAEFFTLTYETPISINHNLAFERIAPLLWMRAGSIGRRIQLLPKLGWEIADSYGIIVDLDKSATFIKALKGHDKVKIVYIVTNDDRRFQSIASRLENTIEPVRLYESYLKNFQFISE